MTDKLEPCPFCGESNVILDVMSRDHSGSPTDYSPECSTCGATIIRTKDMGHDDAIVAWNTRTAHSGEGRNNGAEDDAWERLKQRCCTDPANAEKCVMVSKEDFIAALRVLQSGKDEG